MKIHCLGATVLTFIVLSFTGPTHAWESSDAEITELVSTKREQFILRKTDKLLEQTKLKQCCDEITVSLVVAIHEGVHFLDLGLHERKELPKVLEPDFLEYVKIYTPSLEILPLPDLQAPKPRHLVENYFRRKDTPSYEQMSSLFQSLYDAYINELSALSSKNFFVGFSTELNAYTHGTLTAFNIEQKLKKTVESLSVQRGGSLFFLTLYKVYLQQLRSSHPKIFLQLARDAHARHLIRSLVVNAARAITTSKFCANKPGQAGLELVEDFKRVGGDNELSQVVGADVVEGLNKTVTCAR